jgi:hypothetical protein
MLGAAPTSKAAFYVAPVDWTADVIYRIGQINSSKLFMKVT